MIRMFACVLLLAIAGTASARVVAESVTYEHGGVKLVGYLAYDDAAEGPQPGVLVVPEWWGLNDYAKKRARMLAELGYVAFACDMYGGGKTTDAADTASKWAGRLYGNVERWRGRAMAGLSQLKRHDRVDADRCFAIGYCFGGSTVTQLAWAGADLLGVVSFHGSLPTPGQDEQPDVKCELLICHGAADPMVKPATVEAFKQALAEADATYTFIAYADAEHAFTNPAADDYGIEGVSYDRRADRRSWEHMQTFFNALLDEDDQ